MMSFCWMPSSIATRVSRGRVSITRRRSSIVDCRRVRIGFTVPSGERPLYRRPSALTTEAIRANGTLQDVSHAMLGVLVPEARAARPLLGLVSVSGDAPGVLERPREMQQVPGHERGVASGEIVLWSAGARIEVARSWPGFPDPAGVGLGGNDKTQVL